MNRTCSECANWRRSRFATSPGACALWGWIAKPEDRADDCPQYRVRPLADAIADAKARATRPEPTDAQE